MSRPKSWQEAFARGQAYWESPENSDNILGALPGPVPAEVAGVCSTRMRNLRNDLRDSFKGLYSKKDDEWLVDWLVAALIARENVLLIGPPGTAKTEIALRTFELLGLKTPKTGGVSLDAMMNDANPREAWERRAEQERLVQKYYHFLLHPFTQPDELFGPIEISLLRRGILVRVNFGMLTGPGVRAAFLDEVFKGAGGILNSLLTLTNERKYFNWGGFESSDLAAFIGASNEMPGSFASGAQSGRSPEGEFQLLYAFLDRFSTRLFVPIAASHSDQTQSGNETTPMTQALDIALEREGRRFRTGAPFSPRDTIGGSEPSIEMPTINDLLLLGRYCFQHLPPAHPQAGADSIARAFDPKDEWNYYTAFRSIGAALRSTATDLLDSQITWTISPRKLRSLYKVGLAYALVRSDFSSGQSLIPLEPHHSLKVFRNIWDSVHPDNRDELATQVGANIKKYAPPPLP